MNSQKNSSPLRQSVQHLLQMPTLAFTYVLVFSSLNIFPMLFQWIRGADGRPIMWLMFTSSGIGILLSLVILPFLKAGFYGRIFCRIQNEQDELTFFKRAHKHFKLFFLIALFFFGLQFLFHLVPLTFIPMLFHTETNFLLMHKILGYAIRVLNFIIAVLFLFAYPLATLGYFSQQKMRPITTSVKLVLRHVKMIWPLILIILFKYSYAGIISLLVQSWYLSIPISIISVAIEFFIIVTAFVYLTEKIYPDMEFDVGTNKTDAAIDREL